MPTGPRSTPTFSCSPPNTSRLFQRLPRITPRTGGQTPRVEGHHLNPAMAVTASVRRRWRLLLAGLVVAATLAGLAHAEAAKPRVSRSAAHSAAHKKSH